MTTIGAAAAKVVAGQTVTVAAGEYLENVTPANSGSSSAPIVFTAAPGATVAVSGQTHGFTVSGKSWITLQGLWVRETSGEGILLANSHDLTITANRVSNAGHPVSGQTAKGKVLVRATNARKGSNAVFSIVEGVEKAE